MQILIEVNRLGENSSSYCIYWTDMDSAYSSNLFRSCLGTFSLMVILFDFRPQYDDTSPVAEVNAAKRNFRINLFVQFGT